MSVISLIGVPPSVSVVDIPAYPASKIKKVEYLFRITILSSEFVLYLLFFVYNDVVRNSK